MHQKQTHFIIHKAAFIQKYIDAELFKTFRYATYRFFRLKIKLLLVKKRGWDKWLNPQKLLGDFNGIWIHGPCVSAALGAGQFVEFILTRQRSKTQNENVNCGNTIFFRANLQLLKLQLQLRQSYLHLNLYFQNSNFSHGSFCLRIF